MASDLLLHVPGVQLLFLIKGLSPLFIFTFLLFLFFSQDFESHLETSNQNRDEIELFASGLAVAVILLKPVSFYQSRLIFSSFGATCKIGLFLFIVFAFRLFIFLVYSLRFCGILM